QGDERLEAVTVSNTQTGETETLPAAALFVFIGAIPHTEWVADVLERDSYGFIPTGPDLVVDGRRPRGWNLDRDPYLLEASVPGVFVAGDVRHGSVKRIASAVGEGSVAVQLIHQYLSQM
ncbi:MAG TPA: FAD-dependent oxidoreductase, partial [Chloroflexota bacterium]